MVEYVMQWHEFHIATSAAHAPQISEQLTELEAAAVTFQDGGDQPIFEPTAQQTILWDETIVIGLFSAENSVDPVLSFLEGEKQNGTITNFQMKSLVEQDWERVCLEHFKPMSFGKRLWICPSWHKPPEPKAVNVTLDPGLAFGTGTHPTTGLCLEWLDENIKGGEDVIDYGCGSGILGVAALKLGAKQVRAVDNDPQALTATQQNAVRNAISASQIETYLPENLPAQAADLLVANILFQPLIALAPLFADLIKPQGKIILSGLLFTQAIEIIEVYSTWFELAKPIQKGDWISISGQRLLSL